MPTVASRRAAFTLLITTLAAAAQGPPRRSRDISVNHIHLNSADPDVAIAFYKDVIGMTNHSYESLRGVSTLGATLLFTTKAPSGPSAGSAIDHIAFKVPDLQPFIDRLGKTPYKAVRPAAGDERVMIDGPDGVRIELIEDNSMYASLEFSHIHFHSPQPKEMEKWYVTNLGGQPGSDDNADSILIPGAKLTFTQADSALPTADRAIGHIGFEVKNLDDFCKKLIEKGVQLDSAPRGVPEMKTSVAWLTDPWGTRTELMERAAP